MHQLTPVSLSPPPILNLVDVKLVGTPLQVESLSFSQSKHGEGPVFIVCAATTASKVTRVCVNWSSPIVSDDEGRRFTSVLKYSLRKACDGSSTDFALRSVLDASTR